MILKLKREIALRNEDSPSIFDDKWVLYLQLFSIYLLLCLGLNGAENNGDILAS
jgi:hypothetical protein